VLTLTPAACAACWLLLLLMKHRACQDLLGSRGLLLLLLPWHRPRHCTRRHVQQQQSQQQQLQEGDMVQPHMTACMQVVAPPVAPHDNAAACVGHQTADS
jgi:hypothetical protein